MIVMSAFGFFGQSAYNILDARNSERVLSHAPPKDSFWLRALKSKWSPMSVLSDEEYRDMLREKIMRLDVEIALVDERLEKARQDDLKARIAAVSVFERDRTQ